MTKEFKYYIMLDEGGRRVSPGYPEKGDVPEEVKTNGVLVTKAEFEKLLNGYLRNPQTGEFEPIPPHVPTLDELKEAKKQEIKTAYLEAVTAIVWLETDNGEIGYDADKDSQIDFNLSFQRAQINGTSYYNVYVDKTDLTAKSFVEHTPEMFAVALTAAGNYQEGVYAKYYGLKQQIERAESEEELAVIIW